MLKRIFYFFFKRPLTPRELEWRNAYAKGNYMSYMGVEGVVIFNHDLYEVNVGRSDALDGPAFITMRYVDNAGHFCEIDLFEEDLTFDSFLT